MYHLSSKGGVNSMHVTNFKNKRKRSEKTLRRVNVLNGPEAKGR